MNYEEKYKQSLEKAKAVKETYHNLGNISAIAVLESIFPELKSEDERIRKELIQYLKDYPNLPNGHYCRDDFFSWIEKQGKQKPVEQDTEIHDLWVYIREWNDKFGRLPKDEDELAACIDYVIKRQKSTDTIKPKFKVGDWVVFNNKHQSIYQVEKIEDGYYILRHTHGGTFRVCVLHDESLRLWTIRDAKDGDVLTTDTWTFIFKKYQDKSVYYHCAASTFNDFSISDTGEFDSNYVHPATKEQRELLFQKMKEAGYEGDAEKKELKKIEQKSAWSEKHIADVFEKVGLARIVREQGNDQLTDAVQSAMIELSKTAGGFVWKKI